MNNEGTLLSTFRRTGAALTATMMISTALGLTLMPTIAAAQAQSATDYSIAGGPLSTVLNRFADQSGTEIVYDARLTEGLSSPGLSGRYATAEALSRILAGTGLTFRITGKTVTLERAPQHSATDGATRLGPVTVLGTREINVPISSVPSSITYVDEESIQKDLAVSSRIEDVLARRVPGFNPSNLGVRMIRGRTAQVFINGAPANEQLRAGSGSDLNIISPDHLASIEVSRGANSAYGFGSPGGIIALTTPRATSDTLALATKLRTSFNTDHAEGSFQTTLYQSASQIVGKFDFHVGASFTLDGTNYTPDGDVANTFTSPALFKNGKENIYNVDGSFGYDLGTAGRLRLTTTYQYIDYLKYYSIDGGVYRQTWAATTVVPFGNLSFRKAGTFNFAYENDDILGSTFKLELFGSQVDTKRYEAGSIYYDDNNRYTGVRSAVTTPLNAVTEGMSITYGVDAIRNRLANYRHDATTGARTGVFAPPTTLDMLALYAQTELPLGKTQLSGGVRQEFYGGKVAGVGNATVSPADDLPGGKIRDFDLTLFNAGLLHPLTDHLDLHATYTQGAEVTQLGRAAFAAATPDRVDPQPARSHQYEAGLRYSGTAGSAALTAFYTHSKRISSVDCSIPDLPCTPLREPRRFWGVEFSGDWAINEQWGISGTVAWQDGRRKAKDASVWTRISSAEVAPLHGSVSLDYALKHWWRNKLTLDWRGARARIGSGWPYGEVDSLALVQLASSFDVGPGTLDIGVHNLLNKTYTSIQADAYNGGWAWLPEQGRRVSLGYSVKW